MAYSTPRTWVAGEYPTAAQFNANIRDNVSFLANPPACRVTHNASQSVNSVTETALNFNTEVFDTDSMHDTVTNNSRLTCVTAGLYVIAGCIEYQSAGAASGHRCAIIRHSGAGIIAFQKSVPLNSDSIQVCVSTIYKLAVNDYLTLSAFHSQGSALNSQSAAAYAPTFEATWIGLG